MLLRLLRIHVRPHRRSVAVLGLLQLAQILATLALPTLGAALIDNGVVKADSGYIIRAGLAMLAVALVQVAASVGAVSLGARTAMAMGRDIRSAVFRRVLDFSAREVGQFGTPSLLTRTVNDVQQVQMLAASAFDVAVSAPLMCLGSVALALQQDIELSLLLVALIVVLGMCFGLILGRTDPFYARMQEYLDRINGLLRERIAGVRVVRAFVRDAHESARFDRTNSELRDISLRVGRLLAAVIPVVLLALNGFMVAVLWFGAHRVEAGAIPFGALSAFLSYLALILMSVVMVTFVCLAMPRARVSAERIQQVLTTEPSVAAPHEPVPAVPESGRLALYDVEFRYPGAEEPVLRGIDLSAGPGETVAILGSTGSGKTTLLNLVLRHFDATGGSVHVGGVDVRALDAKVLRRTVGFVPQRPYLFSGTVAGNLRFGDPDATDDELWRVLEIAQARDFVRNLPEGLNAPITQGGTNVSGGQRQRLAIARTLLRKPDIYLFDDCFSALDHATDAALRAALEPELSGATVLTVAQRVSTVRRARRIVVLDAGRVAATGTHEELLRTSTTYREIARSQRTATTDHYGDAGPDAAAATTPREAVHGLGGQR
ncbi:ABC transporter ATP-binding protein [Streptomyces sp. GS7]|uniref:ABC transporter ATP-binding protein n=1 Tax=Streptomyces sp. GS7 TaxID=2692234 RepID=UPI0013163195|nr:ABC transporter ATP-binding protein [Streptomyces sp. GS7]QHC23762.1 ATP-binding cassette domain-containing protein [Streptomyces sp. GS7]